MIVTGGAGAIGSAIAMESAQAGAAVAVCDINECAAKKVADAIQRKGEKPRHSESMHASDTMLMPSPPRLLNSWDRCMGSSQQQES